MPVLLLFPVMKEERPSKSGNLDWGTLGGIKGQGLHMDKQKSSDSVRDGSFCQRTLVVEIRGGPQKGLELGREERA